MRVLALLAAFLCFAPATVAAPFVHPGLLHSQTDLDRIQSAIAAQEQPLLAAWELFSRHPASQATYRRQGPFAEISRNPAVNAAAYDNDATAAYQNALMWCLTGDRTHAAKAIALVDAWSNTLQSISGRDAVLMAALGPFKMINAAELLRHTASGWPAADSARAERCFREVVYPALQNFAPFANGNWDTAAIKTVLAIGVFCNDRAIYERALSYYTAGSGDGRLTHYVINPAGQCQESGRDQSHTQLGLAHLGDACEIAWHQGLDLYAHAENRLLAGFEFTARYNLDGDVPFAPTLDRTGKYRHQTISPSGRGRLRPIYEQILNHYVARQKLPAPFTAQAVARLRPEGASRPVGDHPGFGSLLFAGAITSPAPAAPPAAVLGANEASGIRLTWIATRAGPHYSVRRAEQPTGPYTVIARELTSPSFFDSTSTRGRAYTYIVSTGPNLDSLPVTLVAGLPPPWESATVGAVTPGGHTTTDGHRFTLEAAGTAHDRRHDEFHLTSIPLVGDGAIDARLVPTFNSQSTHAGLTLRATAAPDSAHVAVVLVPVPSGQVEQPGWEIRLTARAGVGEASLDLGPGLPLAAPQVSHGRFVAPIWLRLTRQGDAVTGFTSIDGQTWRLVGATTVSLPTTVRAGLTAQSGLPSITTTVTFDQINLHRGER